MFVLILVSDHELGKRRQRHQPEKETLQVVTYSKKKLTNKKYFGLESPGVNINPGFLWVDDFWPYFDPKIRPKILG